MRIKISVAMIIILTVFSACADTSDQSDDTQVNSTVMEITWVDEGTSLIAEAQYESGLLTGYICYNYFEVTGGSGQVEISVDLESSTGDSIGSRTSTFIVEEGETYMLSAEVNCFGPSDYDPSDPPPGYPNEFTISFRSSSADSTDEKTIQGGFTTGSLSLGQLSLDSWEYTQQQWTLTANVSPEGSGSISDNLGILVYNGEHYVGEYEHGTEVTLTATPAQGYIFEEWYGTYWREGTETDLSVAFTMTISTFIEARFVED